MLERLTTPPLLITALEEAFNTRENIDAVSQGSEMQVSLPPCQLRGTLSLVLGRPRPPSMAALQLSPGEIFLDYFPNLSGKHHTVMIRTRANP